MSKRLGLIIGINKYQDTAFQPLQFAENDARALVQWLANNRGGSWNPSDLQLLLGTQATSELTEALIMQLCLNVAEPGDFVFLYLAGQTFLDETHAEGYLAFTNTRYQQPSTGLSINSLIQKTMLRSRASQVVLMLDCFQTGPTWSRNRTSAFDFKPLSGPTLQIALQQTQGRLLYCSCRGNEFAPEVGEKNVGKFLYHLIVGLSGKALDPDSGQTTLQNLHAFLSNSLDEQHQPQVFGQEQRPVVLVGDMPPLVNGQENRATSTLTSSVPYSSLGSPSTLNQSAMYPQQSSVGVASAQASPSTTGQLSLEIVEQNRKQQCVKLLNQARQLVQMQKIPEALTTLENILQMVPNHLEALILKGQLLRTIGQFQEALAVAGQVVQLDPGNALGWSMCAALLSNTGQFQEALAAIEQSIALNPNHPEAFAIRDAIWATLTRNSLNQQDVKFQSTTVSPGEQGGVKSFFISAVIQIMALLVGAFGASILIVKPQLPIIVAFFLESLALAVLCVNAALGSYLYGVKRFLFTLLICLFAVGMLGALYKVGYHWLSNKIIAFPPLIVPVLFLGFWLVAAAILPLLAALGGLISRITFGRPSKHS